MVLSPPRRPAHPVGRLLRSRLAFVVAVCFALPAAAEHPRLLLTRSELPRLRHLAGLSIDGTPDPAWGRAGALAPDYLALRTAFAGRVSGETLPGEVLAAAFLHLLTPNDPDDSARVTLVVEALRVPPTTTSLLELVLALDWCWSAIPREVRETFVVEARAWAQTLAMGDSPLDSRVFETRLAALALALAVDDADDPSVAWQQRREDILTAARAYIPRTLPAFLAVRTPHPTGPDAAPREELGAALAIELGGLLLERDLWNDYGPRMARWLEHYLLATHAHPGLQQGFLRDDGGNAPTSPVDRWSDGQPLIAHLLAVRTRDPSAVWAARRVEAQARAATAPDPAAFWRWVPLLYDARGLPAADPQRLPIARHLGGAVIFRGGRGPEETQVWINAAAPFLRRRQHFDAGHFLVRRGGLLVGDAGDDIVFEATTAKGGGQFLGPDRAAFDFEQFATASIAHNTIVLWDTARVARWYNQLYLPVGGQRALENTCVDFATPLDRQDRSRGTTLAYDQLPDTVAYLALDLSAAYDRRDFSAYTREFVFVVDGVLLVIDRVTLTRVTPGRSSPVPTWLLQLPTRPTIDGHDLRDEQSIAGTANDAGVWRVDEANWLRWTERDGALWFNSLSPVPRAVRVVGGPGEQLRIPDGRHADRPYYGGAPLGFERLIVPAERGDLRNAWYRLARPTVFGAALGRSPHWGRIEVEPLERGKEIIFVHALVTDAAESRRPAPQAEIAQTHDVLTITLKAADTTLTLQAPLVGRGITLALHGARSVNEWRAGATVAEDGPLPLVPEAAGEDLQRLLPGAAGPPWTD